MPLWIADAVGEDFDWANDQLTYYSRSKDRIDYFYRTELFAIYKVAQVWDMIVSGGYEISRHRWFDTLQYDYTVPSVTQSSGESLRYDQQKYRLGFGLAYRAKYKHFIWSVTPELSYIYHSAIDQHLVRGFYTVQKNQGLEMALKVAGTYHISKSLSCYTAYSICYFEDKQSDMAYYFSSIDEWYQTLPSRFSSFTEQIDAGIRYHF